MHECALMGFCYVSVRDSKGGKKFVYTFVFIGGV